MPIVPIKIEPQFQSHEEERDTEPSAPKVTTAKKDYTVGYGKPPTRTQFRKGQSGNPKGRPKLAKSLNTIIREEMLARVPVRTSAGIRHITRAHALFLKHYEQASKGNIKAIDKLLDRYMAAVPEPSIPVEHAEPLDFSEADQAILELLKDRLIGGGS